MPTRIESYRDLDVWQKAMEIAVDCYRITESFPVRERFGLAAQLQRAAASVPSNLAEGHGRSITREYLHHLAIAHGSLMEVETQIELAARLGYVERAAAEELLGRTGECGRMLHGLIKRLRELAGEQAASGVRR